MNTYHQQLCIILPFDTRRLISWQQTGCCRALQIEKSIVFKSELLEASCFMAGKSNVGIIFSWTMCSFINKCIHKFEVFFESKRAEFYFRRVAMQQIGLITEHGGLCPGHVYLPVYFDTHGR